MKVVKKRLELIDSLRGLAIISMIGFHACWIMSYFGILISSDPIHSLAFEIWERSICCTFIFVAGFAFSLGSRQFKKGMTILLIGVAITVLSVIFMYDIRDIFGVLWILGISPLIIIPIDRLIKKKTADNSRTSDKPVSAIFMILCLFIVVATWEINHGYLGLRSTGLYYNLPDSLYRGYFMTFLGFQMPGFYSVDYFSFFPWFFLYAAGYFAKRLTSSTRFEEKILTQGIPCVKLIGKYSLPIYLIHPVVIYVVCFVIYMIMTSS